MSAGILVEQGVPSPAAGGPTDNVGAILRWAD